MPAPADYRELIARIRALPEQVAHLTADLTAEQLATPCLAGEWTVAQNVYHLADAHIYGYVRCKLIATEECPALPVYAQERWALLPEATRADIADAVALLRSLHARWVTFWDALDEAAWERAGLHPERGVVTLADLLRLYADHGAGHLAQMTRTLAAGTGRESRADLHNAHQ